MQVTSDLAGFWQKHYPPLRRELGRRYPKHSWPEDGRTAQPPPPKRAAGAVMRSALWNAAIAKDRHERRPLARTAAILTPAARRLLAKSALSLTPAGRCLSQGLPSPRPSPPADRGRG